MHILKITVPPVARATLQDKIKRGKVLVSYDTKKLVYIPPQSTRKVKREIKIFDFTR